MIHLSSATPLVSTNYRQKMNVQWDGSADVLESDFSPNSSQGTHCLQSIVLRESRRVPAGALHVAVG